MQNDDEFSPEQLKALDTIEKLLRLAAKNNNAEEAAAAAGKAQELLALYNLDVDSVGKTGSSGDQRREQKVIKGGMYTYQRELWSQIAKLNFCMYWTIEHCFIRTIRRRHWSGEMRDVKVDGKEFRHTLVGKRMNVKATLMMAEYLQGAIERLVKERYPQNSQRFMREAIAYREGMADELYWRLAEKRKQMVEDMERRKQEELLRNGVSTSNALTLGSLAEQEEDANNDFLHGEGWSAKQRARRAEAAAAQRRAEEEYTRWAEAHPEEARKEEEKRAKERKKNSSRWSGGRGSRGGMMAQDKRSQSSEYWQGRDKGKTIGLDPQTSSSAKAKLLT